MPEKIIASVIAEKELKLQKMFIASSHTLAPAVAWAGKNDQLKIISEVKCCNKVISPEELNGIIESRGKTPVLIVLHETDEIRKKLPVNRNTVSVDGIYFWILD